MARFNPAGVFPPIDQAGNVYTNNQIGVATAFIASGAGNTVISAAAGRLCKVIVTTAGTGSGNVNFYDNATTNTGNVLGAISASASIGVTDFQVPAVNGITVANVVNGPVLAVTYH